MKVALTRARADQLTMRAHLAFACWIAVAGGMAILGLVMLILGLVGRQPPIAIGGGLVLAWLGSYTLACAYVVWSYRRWIGPYRASPIAEDRMQAERLTEVQLLILPIAELGGVRVGQVVATPMARRVNSPWVIVCHLGMAAILLLIGVASGELR